MVGELNFLSDAKRPEFAAPWALVAALGLGLAMGLALSRPQLQARAVLSVSNPSLVKIDVQSKRSVSR